MQRTRNIRAFTLAELLVGLIVTSILLSAVATLAFALSSATRASDEAGYTQTQLRTATPRILDLIRCSRMICARFIDCVAMWKADDNGNDRIDVNELAYLAYDDANDLLRVYEFNSAENPSVLVALELPGTTPVLTELSKPATKTVLLQAFRSSGELSQITVLRDCHNLELLADQDPPRTRRLVLSFDLIDQNGAHRYEIDAALRVSAEHLLNSDATDLIPDDD